MPKYILLDYESKWKNDVFRMFYHIANYLVTELNYILVDTSSYTSNNKLTLTSFLIQDNEIHKILVIENHDDKLLLDFLSDLKIIESSNNIEFYLLTDDIHKNKDRKIQLEYYNLFSKIYVNYYKPFFEQYPDFSSKFPEKIVWIPHCVPEAMLTNFNNKPILKIGLLGNTADKVYPHRSYLKKISIQDSNLKDKIAEKAHPSKKYKPIDYDSNKLVGQTYFNTLRSFLCNFTCSLTLGYTVCKYFEIAATGSLLLCDPTHDDLSQLGFIDMETCIIYKHPEEIKEKILWILDYKNRDKIDQIRQAGMELVRKKHTVSVRCREIDNLLTFSSSSI